jgi:TRAP-type C4-dicarboxylate transport system permease small subunit
MAVFKKVFLWFFRLLENLAAVFIVIMVLVVFFDVLQRNLIHRSMSWTQEIASLMMVWFGFIGIAIGALERIHISIEIFTMKLPPKVIEGIVRAGYLIIAFFGGLMVRYGVGIMEATRNTTMPATQWPSSVLYIILPVSGILIILNSFFVVFGLDTVILASLKAGTGKERNNG